jgi:hypothetical protein
MLSHSMPVSEQCLDTSIRALNQSRASGGVRDFRMFLAPSPTDDARRAHSLTQEQSPPTSLPLPTPTLTERPRSLLSTQLRKIPISLQATIEGQYQASSDLDFGLEEDDRDTNIGKRARASIVLRSTSDRVASKKAVKTLKPAANSPGTDYQHRYWLTLFTEFATTTLDIEKRPK